MHDQLKASKLKGTDTEGSPMEGYNFVCLYCKSEPAAAGSI